MVRSLFLFKEHYSLSIFIVMTPKQSGTHLYIIQDKKTKDIKIGRSNDPYYRLDQLQTANSNKLHIILIVENQGYREKILHKRLSKYNKNGEWFTETALPELPIDIYELLNLDNL